jgi:hypothetical protein
MVITTAFAVAVVYGTWLPISFTHSLPLLYFFSAIFGLGSGSIISLAPVCFGQLCKANDYGRFYGTAYSVVSFAYVILRLISFLIQYISLCYGDKAWTLLTTMIGRSSPFPSAGLSVLQFCPSSSEA